MTRGLSDRLVLAILGCAVLCGGIAGGLLAWPVPEPAPPAASLEDAPSADDPAAGTVAGQDEADRAIVAQPIFNRDRLPDPPPRPLAVAEPQEPLPPEPVAVASDALDGLVLVGIAISDGGRVALLRREGGEALLRLRPGDKVEDWAVIAVEQAAVVLRSGEEVRRIGFRKGT